MCTTVVTVSAVHLDNANVCECSVNPSCRGEVCLAVEKSTGKKAGNNFHPTE